MGAQLDFGRGLILVDRAVKFDPKRGQRLGLPKGDKRRMAVMADLLAGYLEKAFAGSQPDRVLWSCARKNEPKLKRNFYRTWGAVVTKAGLPPETSPHDCRLTHVNWIEKLCPDVSPTTLKEHVGHAAVGVTEANYTRPLTTAQAILREAIDHLMSIKN